MTGLLNHKTHHDHNVSGLNYGEQFANYDTLQPTAATLSPRQALGEFVPYLAERPKDGDGLDPTTLIVGNDCQRGRQGNGGA